MSDLVTAIKKLNAASVDATMPMAVITGTVVSTNPLAVKIDQKITVPAAMLRVTDSVRERYVDLKMEEDTSNAGDPGHTHKFEGAKQYLFKTGLSIDDQVLLIREKGGQTYIIIDRVSHP